MWQVETTRGVACFIARDGRFDLMVVRSVLAE